VGSAARTVLAWWGDVIIVVATICVSNRAESESESESERERVRHREKRVRQK
jgi:hypothetical protein